ncbi:hypothetical protein UNH65_22360 [Chitinophaga sp. 180180018-2]|nr:hypothetical protein [Chitinophaga sp. 212800010-3]
MSADNTRFLQKLLLYVLFMYMPYCCYAQVKNINQPLHLPLHEMRLDSLSACVSREAGIVFSFNATKIDPAQKLAMPRMPVTVRELLAYLNNKYQLSFAVTGNHVILRNESPRQLIIPRKQPPATRVAVKASHTATTRPQPHNTPRTKEVMQPAPAITDSTPSVIQRIRIHENYVLPQPAPALLTVPAVIPVKPIAALPSPMPGSVAKSRSPKGNNSFFMATGIAADDAFYFSPGINAGFPWLYAIGRWNTNFHVNGWSYGLGTSFRIAGSWRMYVDVTTGSLTKDYPAVADSLTNIKVGVKGQLSRLELQVEKVLNNRLSLRFGPVINLLHTTYYLNGIKTAPDNMIFPRQGIENNYYLIKPVYTISNTYSDQSASNNKIWIGIRAGLYFRIR